jgi:hypothetical protein
MGFHRKPFSLKRAEAPLDNNINRHARRMDCLEYIQISDFGARPDFSGPVALNHIDKFLDATQEKIFGAKDVLMLDASMFAQMREPTMAAAAHEIRHELDQNSESVAFKKVPSQQQEIATLLKTNGTAMVKADKEALAKSPHFQQYMKAMELFKIADEPQLKGTAQLKAFLDKEREETLNSASSGLLQDYLSKKTDYETRGYWEQARYARVALGWDGAKYLKMMTHDIPAHYLNNDPNQQKVHVINFKIWKKLVLHILYISGTKPTLVRIYTSPHVAKNLPMIPREPFFRWWT